MDKPSDLKPCPFCGGAARLLAWDTEENHADPRPDIYGCAPCEIYMEREEWNRRTPDRAALLEVARRAALADVARLTKREDELRRAVATLIGADPETWPNHGNAPLAIAATVALRINERDRARAALATATERRFPIMDGGPSIPWSMVAPHAAQAKQNHSQTLDRLAERGGLSPYEALCVLDGRNPFKSKDAWPDPRAELERRRANYEEHRECRAALAEAGEANASHPGAK